MRSSGLPRWAGLLLGAVITLPGCSGGPPEAVVAAELLDVASTWAGDPVRNDLPPEILVSAAVDEDGTVTALLARPALTGCHRVEVLVPAEWVLDGRGRVQVSTKPMGPCPS